VEQKAFNSLADTMLAKAINQIDQIELKYSNNSNLAGIKGMKKLKVAGRELFQKSPSPAKKLRTSS
jgi:hypothetical protein